MPVRLKNPPLTFILVLFGVCVFRVFCLGFAFLVWDVVGLFFSSFFFGRIHPCIQRKCMCGKISNFIFYKNTIQTKKSFPDALEDFFKNMAWF